MAAGFARPYVDALLAVAGSPAAVAALLPDLEAFERALEESPDLRDVLRNPVLERGVKSRLLGEVTAKLGTGPLATRLLAALLSNRRLTQFSGVIAAIRERLDREQNVVEARVRSARPLSRAQTEALRAALEVRMRRTLRLRAEAEPALLGGFVVRIGSEVYDASLAARLWHVRAVLREGTPG